MAQQPQQISLLAYLQYAPPQLAVLEQGQSRANTRNPSYRYTDITQTGPWADFTMGTIMNAHGQLLHNTPVHFDPPGIPPQPINSEVGFRERYAMYLKSRIIRALDCGFHRLAAAGRMVGRTRLDCAEGTLAETIDEFTPDVAYFDPSILLVSDRANRVPGDFKPSWKWSHALQHAPGGLREFKQALSQVNWYMKQHHTRYGFILTNNELVAIKRVNNNGHLLLSEPIPWTAHGTAAQPRLTVLLALWYLGMLGSNDQDWRL